MPLEAVRLPQPRVAPPGGALAAVCSQEHRDRATHAYGKSYLDTVRAFRGVYEHVPDLVARPREEADVEALLEWAAGANVAVIPYGGGTSVVGGVEPRIPARLNGALSLDLGALDAPARAGRGLARGADRRGRRRARASRSCSERTA